MDFIGYGFGKTALNTAVVNYKNLNNFMVNKQINKQTKQKRKIMKTEQLKRLDWGNLQEYE